MGEAALRVDGAWLRSRPIVRLFAALPEGSTRCVGGCVRDSLADLPVKDVDLATTLPPEETIARLKRAGIAVVPTGLKHGTVTAVIEHSPYEITTLRRDVDTDGRHAEVVFTDDWHADASRRDLTINAIYCDPDGSLFDPFGGAEDLAEGRVRFVGDPRERIREDYLRLLRFFRFQARFGRGDPDPAAIAACRELAPGVARLSAERVHDELLKLLGGPRVAETIRLMTGTGVLLRADPGLVNVDRLERLIRVEETAATRLAGVRPDPVRRLGALLAEGEEAAERLRLSNREKARLAAMHLPAPALTSTLDPVRRRELIFDLGPEPYRDRCLLAWADDPHPDAEQWLEVLAEADTWRPPEFPLAGRDVLALGVPPGPLVGSLLRRVRRWWREGGFTADRSACLVRLRKLAGRVPPAPTETER